MRKELLALLSLVGLVILAGCIGQTPSVTTGAASGVVIKSFAPDLPEVFSGDSVTFTLLVENIGQEDATSVSAKLYGLGTDFPVTSEKTQSIGDLTKAQPTMGVPGGQDTATWDATSPSDLKVDKEYTANVRVYYSYKTTGSGSIKVYNSDYLKTINQEEARRITTSSGLDSWTVSNGPINIELAGAARPFVVKSGGMLSASISVLISNKGQGYPYFDTDETDRRITVDTLTINGQGCTNSIDTDPTIPRTGKKSISCKFSVDSSSVADFTTIPISVELSYKYYIDGTTTVKVLQTLA